MPRNPHARWIRRLENEPGCTLLGTALDPLTGAVFFAAQASGTVRFGGEVLGEGSGPGSLLVHRFVP